MNSQGREDTQPSTTGGLAGNRHLEDLLTCSICMSTYTDPFITPCGHSFCYSCINQHLAAGTRQEQAGAGGTSGKVARLCPQCSKPLEKKQLNPSFSLNDVAKHVSQMRLHTSQEAGPYLSLKTMMKRNKDHLTSKELEQLSKQIVDYKQEAERKEKAGTMNLLLHFLHQSKEEKARRLEALQREIECLDADITACSEVGILGRAGDEQFAAHEKTPVRETDAKIRDVDVEDGKMNADMNVLEADEEKDEADLEDEARERCMRDRRSGRSQKASQLSKTPSKDQSTHQPSSSQANTFDTVDTVYGNSGAPAADGKGTNAATDPLCSHKRRRIASQFEDLQSVYLKLRSSSQGLDDREEGSLHPNLEDDSGSVDPATVITKPTSGLQKFSKILGTLAHANRLRILAEITRPPLRNQSSIISSAEYDRNGKFFATAGVSKRISIFDHTNTMTNANHALPIAHCPIVEMVTRSKLSCITWNKFISSELASSDYEGVLNVWDTSTGDLVQEYEAHSKRIWSVDFCCADPKLLVTGSDDSFVKVWSTRSPSTIAQCDVKANVCAVKWHPTHPHTVAIGAADHNVYVYDMRKFDTYMSSFSGHKKAVSYVRWAGNDEIVSASTDCTLRLWNTRGPSGHSGPSGPSPTAPCYGEERIYRGHLNERNFVGLTVSNDFIVCGSETHEVFAYYKPLSKPITKIALPFGGLGARMGPLGGTHAGGGSNVSNVVGGGARERDRPFVSSVSWHPTKKEILAATSQGSVFVLSLEGDLHGDTNQTLHGKLLA